ncbi:MAG: NAD(P)-binding domain-containing protein [Candidatus Marinimicrobia bacterium]|nr:NAD(P)-binding domain-containing protein [Candidatus Neomarinimicrobiota bacterium]
MTETPILVVGQGPYGLSLANYLASQGQDFKIIGKPMELWRKHTFSDASLRSDMATSEIADPHQAYSISTFRQSKGGQTGEPTERITVKEYRQYIDWVFAQIPYPLQEDLVEKLIKHQDHFVAVMESGKVIRAKQVVIATGVAHHLNIPPEFKKARDVIHAYHVGRIEALRQKRVLVVGAGQSAAEAIEVCRKNGNQVDWYSRKAPKYYSEPLDLPKWIFDLVVQSAGLFRRLPPGIIKRLFAIFSATTMTPDNQTKLSDITRLSKAPGLDAYDHVITATGYRYSLNHMKFLGKELRESLKMRADMPRIDKNFMSSMENLYFIGPPTEAFFGPPMKFMIGSQYVAPRLSQILAK